MVENTRVPANEDAVDDARDVKEDMDETWSDVFRFYAEYREDIDQRIQDMMSGDADDVGEDLQKMYEMMERIESSVQVTEERTGAIDRKVEDLQR